MTINLKQKRENIGMAYKLEVSVGETEIVLGGLKCFVTKL